MFTMQKMEVRERSLVESQRTIVLLYARDNIVREVTNERESYWEHYCAIAASGSLRSLFNHYSATTGHDGPYSCLNDGSAGDDGEAG